MPHLLHTPLGLEHPYEQLPEERFPRRPLAGEPFTVGLVTRPPGSVDAVTLYSRIDDGPLSSVSAERIPDWDPAREEGVGAEFLEREIVVEQDVWRAPLMAPAHGHTLTYWAECDGARTPNFTLPGEAWASGGGPVVNEAGDMVIRRDEATSATIPNLPQLENVEWLTDGTTARRVRLRFACAAGERFFGLGERFNALNQRGNVLDIRCYEQYKNQGKRTYLPIPFLLSSLGYGLWVQSARWMQFDLAASRTDCWTLEADLGPEEALTLSWFQAEDPFVIVGDFARRTGPPVLPPAWSFGLWMSGNEWNSLARVEQEVAASFEHGITPGVIVLEAWSDEATFYIWNDAEYAPRPGNETFQYADFTFPTGGKWPDPKAMIDGLHAQGIRVLLWQVPILKADEGNNEQHALDRAHFLRAGYAAAEADDSPHAVRPFWFRGGEIWDVTNPAARDWWFRKRAYLIDELGIDGFKTDGGEHLWGESVRFADGRRGDELWNEYPQLYSQAYFDFANGDQAGAGDQGAERITFSRAGYTGSQRAPLHWAGDENSTWDAFRRSILAGLSAGLSGIPFWGWDFGGFSGEVPSAELYLRAMAMATFCPVMQYHSEYNAHRAPSRDRTPWNIQARWGDDRVIPGARFFTNLRHNLLPYIWQEARHAAATGRPMMRSAQVSDPAAGQYDYCFGRDLLISPVVEPDVTEWTVCLPRGRWRDFWTGDAYVGGQAVEIAVPLTRIPVFVRAGASIPLRLGPSGALGKAVTGPGVATEANYTLRFG
ncbi:MAG: hypothetical protein KDD92_20535 [Caldilineaceae bacterium]|nr:hypothetical protein [Caldilineaceae bacterium]